MCQRFLGPIQTLLDSATLDATPAERAECVAAAEELQTTIENLAGDIDRQKHINARLDEALRAETAKNRPTRERGN